MKICKNQRKSNGKLRKSAKISEKAAEICEKLQKFVKYCKMQRKSKENEGKRRFGKGQDGVRMDQDGPGPAEAAVAAYFASRKQDGLFYLFF